MMACVIIQAFIIILLTDMNVRSNRRNKNNLMVFYIETKRLKWELQYKNEVIEYIKSIINKEE